MLGQYLPHTNEMCYSAFRMLFATKHSQGGSLYSSTELSPKSALFSRQLPKKVHAGKLVEQFA